MKRLVFLDVKCDAKEYINKVKDSAEFKIADTHFVAMSLKAAAYLKSAGFQATATDAYFNRKAHESASENSQKIIEWLKENAQFVDLSLGVKRAYRDMLVFWSRFAINHCLWTIDVVTEAIRVHNPEIISAVSAGKRKTSSLCLEPDEKNLGVLVKLIAAEKGLVFEEAVSKRLPGISRNIFSAGFFGKALKFFAQYFRLRLKEQKLLWNIKTQKNRLIFFTTPFYNLEKLALEYQIRFPDERFFLLPGPILSPFRTDGAVTRLFFGKCAQEITRQKLLFADLCRRIMFENKLFEYRGIDFSGLIAAKISRNIGEYICGLLLWSVRLKRFIGKTKPKLIISNGNRADDVITSELCRAFGIPDLLISHGSHVGVKNSTETSEWGEHANMLVRAPYSHIALQTPVTEDFFRSFPTQAKLLRTGPLIWGKQADALKSKALFQGFFGQKYEFGKIKILLHAGTPKPTKSLRFYVYETPDEYIKALRDLAATVETMQNVFLIVKFRPSSEISVADLKTMVSFSEKVLLSVEHPFLDVLGMTDLLVSFSSTTIEEALQNNVPVLLYGGEGRYQHLSGFSVLKQTELQKSSVYHIADAEYLAWGIKSILSLGIEGRNKDRHLFEAFRYSGIKPDKLEELF